MKYRYIEVLYAKQYLQIHTFCIVYVWAHSPVVPNVPHFLTRRVSRLLRLALVSWAFACVVVLCLSLSYLGCFSFPSSSSAIEFHSCYFFMNDVSAPIQSTLPLLMVSFKAW